MDVTGVETQKAFDIVLTNLARTAPPIPGFRRTKGGKILASAHAIFIGIICLHICMSFKPSYFYFSSLVMAA